MGLLYLTLSQDRLRLLKPLKIRHTEIKNFSIDLFMYLGDKKFRTELILALWQHIFIFT